MARLALVGGHGTLVAALGDGGRRVEHGRVVLVERTDAVILERHGPDDAKPPHRIDHHANLEALAAAGCDRVLGLGSVGALRSDWPVGTVLAPDDFYAPLVNPTRFDDARGYQVPGFDRGWRGAVVDAWRRATATPIRDGGVYAQTIGPRFETPAEVRALGAVADVVGMTAASECVLAPEYGLAYASICVVDNLANGLEAAELTLEQYRGAAAVNRARLVRDLHALVARLTGGAP
jgi:5'-methylthioadenosine phosphorylase